MRSKTQSSRKSWRIFFRGFSPPKFPFCTIHKPENSEMKTSEIAVRHFDQTLRYYFDQTLRFSNSKFSILHHSQSGKLGVFSDAICSNSEVRVILDFTGFYQMFPIFHYSQKHKTQELKPRSFLFGIMIKLQGFPTPSFLFCTTVKTENSEFSPRPFDQTPGLFHLRVFGLRYSAKTKLGSCWKLEKLGV